MHEYLITAIKGILDIVYPPICLNCGAFSQIILCDKCEESLPLFTKPFCCKCGKPTVRHVPTCRECSNKKYYISKLRALGPYNGTLKQLIKMLKYSGSFRISEYLGMKIAYSFYEELSSDKITIITYIPSRRSKRAHRGYNQSELIAKVISKTTSLPTIKTLVKTRHTREQAGLNKTERAKNIKGSFKCINIKKINDKKIVLIDDVFTSGSTINEAAKILIRSGAKEVIGIVAARTLNK